MMGKQELTVEEIKSITGWAHGTAFSFAKKHGQLRQGETPRGKWYVPITAVEEVVNKHVLNAQNMQARFISIATNGNEINAR